MKTEAIGRLLKFSVSTALIAAIFMTYSMTALAQPALTGELLVAGPGVVVNGEPGTNGRTLVLPSNIMTTGSTYATLNFGKVGKIQLAPGTTFTIDGSGTSLRGTLSAGSVTVVSSENLVPITTPCGKVVNANSTDVVSVSTACGGAPPPSAQSGTGLGKIPAWGWAAILGGAVLAAVLVSRSGDSTSPTT